MNEVQCLWGNNSLQWGTPALPTRTPARGKYYPQQQNSGRLLILKNKSEKHIKNKHARDQSKSLTIFDGPGIAFILIPEKGGVVKRSALGYLEKAGVLASTLT